MCPYDRCSNPRAHENRSQEEADRGPVQFGDEAEAVFVPDVAACEAPPISLPPGREAVLRSTKIGMVVLELLPHPCERIEIRDAGDPDARLIGPDTRHPPLLAQRAPTAIRTSLPLERWLALLQERAKAFFRIGHREEAILQFSLEREALVHRHLEAFRDRALDEADRARGVLRIRQAVREGHRLLPELRSGEDPIQEAPVERLFRREHSARGHEVDRATLADKPRESLRASRSGKDAERHLRQSDPPGSVRGETEVGRHGDFESAADAMSVDRGDEELRRALHLVQNLLAI